MVFGNKSCVFHKNNPVFINHMFSQREYLKFAMNYFVFLLSPCAMITDFFNILLRAQCHLCIEL